MTGLVRQKNYDWKDSNLSLFGSDTEKNVKKESSQHEPAWKNAGSKVGLQIWRIVNFKVTKWPQEDYGKFFGGDSYIILHTYKATPTSDALSYDVHFWIGSSSTADEYGTAAYKTVELDTFLDDKPVQHRQVQGHESQLFKSYFPKGIIILEGGAESGFRHVQAASYQPRLLHVCGLKKSIVVTEVPLACSRLDSDDVFILDLGNQLYQWNGKGSNKDERFKGMQVLNDLRSERPKATWECLEDADTPTSHEFYGALTQPDQANFSLFSKIEHSEPEKQELFRVSDEKSGVLEMKKVKEGPVSLKDLESKDVFIIDTGKECFVWIGKGASTAERQNSFGYAHHHLMKTSHPLINVIVVKEGQKNHQFSAAIAA